MKKVCIFFMLFLSLQAFGNAYDYSFQSIDEKSQINLGDYKGKVIMVVNTASLCGFKKQYAVLQKLYEKYGPKGFVVIAVPSGNFAGQELKDNQSIKKFCETNFGITFPVTSRTDVVGENSHPFFKWTRSTFGKLSGPQWNFYKFIINREGNLVDWFASTTSPDSKKIISLIETLL